MSANNFKKLEEEQEPDPFQLSGIEHRVHSDIGSMQTIGNFFGTILSRFLGVLTAFLGGSADPKDHPNNKRDI